MAKSPYDYFMETLSKTNPTSHKILKSMVSSLTPSGKKSDVPFLGGKRVSDYSQKQLNSLLAKAEKKKPADMSNRATSQGGRSLKEAVASSGTGGKAKKRLSPAMAQSKRRMEAMRKDADMTINKKTAKVDPSKKVRPQGTTKSKNYNLGVSKGGVPFKEAFAHFRKKGNKTFTWNGKKYTTELKKDKK